MLNTLLIVVGFVGGLIPLLDLLLSDEQKASLVSRTRRTAEKLRGYRAIVENINPGEFSNDTSFDVFRGFMWTIFGLLCASSNYIIALQGQIPDSQRWFVFFSTMLLVGGCGYLSFSLTDDGEPSPPLSIAARTAGLLITFCAPIWGAQWILKLDTGPSAHFWNGLLLHAILIFFCPRSDGNISSDLYDWSDLRTCSIRLNDLPVRTGRSPNSRVP